MRALTCSLVLALAGCGSPGDDSSTTAGSTSASSTSASSTGGATAPTSTGDPSATSDDAGGSGDASSGGAASTTTGDGSTTGASATTGELTTTTGDASTTGGPVWPCNGHAELCARRFDEVVFPMTHNSYSSKDDGFSLFNANQIHPVSTQLAEGIRGLMLDVEMDGDEVIMCHGPCLFGQVAHLDVLADIADFLAKNPREIVTIIYQDGAPVAEIAADLAATGLDQLAFTYQGGPFPTLGEMIDANTRLVVTAESGGPPPAWFHHVWDVTWDTPYTFHSVDEFSCELNRGDQANPLFLINHWLSTNLDLPSEDGAKQVNVYDVLHARAVQCMQETGDLPNFLGVDFYEHGDLFAVVDALNGV